MSVKGGEAEPQLLHVLRLRESPYLWQDGIASNAAVGEPCRFLAEHKKALRSSRAFEEIGRSTSIVVICSVRQDYTCRACLWG